MKTIGMNLKDNVDPTGIMHLIDRMMRQHFPEIEYELFRQDAK